ncbi:MAG: hypothetical protein ACXWP4_17980, partial [Polyangiales bacterium]
MQPRLPLLREAIQLVVRPVRSVRVVVHSWMLPARLSARAELGQAAADEAFDGDQEVALVAA